MRNTIFSSGSCVVLSLIATLVAACSGSGGGGSAHTGMAAIVLRDGTIQTSDGRTVTSLLVDVSRITLRSQAGDEQGDDEQGDDSDGEGDHHGDENTNGDDDQHGDHGGTEVVVFDMDRDNGGVPRSIDLLTLTSSGVLFNMLRIPVGTYDRAAVSIVGATALFEDDPTQTPVVLLIDADEGSEFKFEFAPPVVVTSAAMSIAAIDIVPVITLEGSSYTLSHDGDSDQSGQCGDGDLPIEVEGTVTAVNGEQIELGDYQLALDLSSLGPVVVHVGDRVEAEGHFDHGVLVVQSLEIED